MSSDSRDIVVDVFVPAPRGVVWHAIADSAPLAQWFLPNDLEPSLATDFTFTRPQESRNPLVGPQIRCRVLGASYASRLTYSWHEDTPAGPLDTTVEWSLTSAGRGTQVVVGQHGFSALPPAFQDVRAVLLQEWRLALTQRLPDYLLRSAA